jgi:predicted AlkP superfamily phosphohydrolase/phosphomutase
VDKDTVILVMSDHGFNPFVRGFNLNTWLRQSGYLRLKNEFRSEDLDFAFAGTNWARTRAYGIGLNGLYLNIRGREADGIVEPSEAETLLREIASKLEAFADPATGEKVIHKAYLGRDVYSGPDDPNRPDIVIGYNRGYRISWRSPLGRVPKEILEENRQKWSGDHMGAAEILPGIVLSNRPIRAEMPSLTDLTATVLDVFGIRPPEDMIGRTVL